MYLLNIQVALIFELDEQIIFTLGERLKEAQKKYIANLQLLNVPNGVPPEAPRLLFMASNFNLNISLNRVDIFITPPDQIKTNINACLNYALTTINSLYNLLLKNVVKYNWCGIILNLNYPEKIQPSIKAMVKIAPYILKTDSKGREMASLNLQIGFKEPPYFKNITIFGYDQYQLAIPTPNVQNPNQDIQNTPIEESGITILLDINNKPQSDKNSFENDFSNLIKKIEISYMSLLDELNLEGVINA
uniref:Uncharacterized protein n=1 Tax=uncultured bacterium contig00026 TaxID=1181515 RepID=A0A806KF57_9BACT|nr:hypothetical protein [uncultured bacterium contig00026]